jgi:hypothetical protein
MNYHVNLTLHRPLTEEIQTIKAIRHTFGWSLKNSKDLLDFVLSSSQVTYTVDVILTEEQLGLALIKERLNEFLYSTIEEKHLRYFLQINKFEAIPLTPAVFDATTFNNQ